MANAFSYSDGAVREDLLDILTNLSPTDTQLITGLATSKAMAQRHEWLTDTLSDVKTNAFAEGAAATQHAVTSPTRLINYTQISRQGFQVSDTERAVNTANFNDRYNYEAEKAMKMIKNDMELAVLRGSLACGAAAVTGQCKGIKNWLSLVTSQSGISLSETTFNDYLQNVWNVGTEVNAAYMGITLKRRIASWTGAATAKNTEVNDKRLVNTVSIYEADAAKIVKLFAHRHVNESVNNDIVGINEDLFRVAYLRKPFNKDIPSSADGKVGEIISEYTLECLQPWGGFLGEKHL